MRTYPKKLVVALLLTSMLLAGETSVSHAAPNDPYEGLGGSIFGNPVTVSWGPNRLDTFVVSGDHQLYHKAWDGSHWLPSPTGYEQLGGVIRDGSSPAIVSRGPNRLDIFAVDQDQGLDHKAWESTQWLPAATDVEHLGGVIADGASPAAVVWGGERLSVYVVGTDHALYHKAWDGAHWWAYENLGGSLAAGSSPTAATWGAGRMDVFVVGSDAQLYHKGCNSYEWLPYARMAATPISGPTKWAVLLCKTADHPEEPQSRQFFRNLFTEDGAGQGGMFDYWRDMSRGRISLAGSQVAGWYTMSQTLAQLNTLSRQTKIRACIAAAADFSFVKYPGTRFYAIAVMFNTPSVDSGAAGSATLYNASVMTTTIMLAALTQQFIFGYDMAKIYAFGRSDHYYTVELHRASGWDRGLRQNVVLIHEVLPDERSYLVTDSGGPEWLAGQTFSDPEAHLSVSVDSITDIQATIHILRIG